MILVKEIGLSWLQSDKVDSFIIGLILASFHSEGTHWSCKERFNTYVSTGAR